MSGTCLKDAEDFVYDYYIAKNFPDKNTLKIVHALIWSKERLEYHPHAVALLDNKWIIDCSYDHKAYPFMVWARHYKAKRIKQYDYHEHATNSIQTGYRAFWHLCPFTHPLPKY